MVLLQGVTSPDQLLAGIRTLTSAQCKLAARRQELRNHVEVLSDLRGLRVSTMKQPTKKADTGAMVHEPRVLQLPSP